MVMEATINVNIFMVAVSFVPNKKKDFCQNVLKDWGRGISNQIPFSELLHETGAKNNKETLDSVSSKLLFKDFVPSFSLFIHFFDDRHF